MSHKDLDLAFFYTFGKYGDTDLRALSFPHGSGAAVVSSSLAPLEQAVVFSSPSLPITITITAIAAAADTSVLCPVLST